MEEREGGREGWIILKQTNFKEDHTPYYILYHQQPNLILMARSLTVLCQRDKRLCDQLNIVGMDVETEQH